MSRSWARGATTGVGSLPGTDPLEAVRTVLGEHPLLPYLPELPARGAGADMIGRTAALLVDLPVEIAPTGWRMTGRPGRDLRRARDLLERDLDALEAVAAGHAGPWKLQAVGPWTLAAGVELANGNRVLTDHGAVRDLTEALAEGLREHVADVARRLPRATIVGQLDEPSLPAVLAAQIPTASGYGTIRGVDVARARTTLATVLSALPDTDRIVHCCAADAPVALLREAGATAVGLDLSLLTPALTDAVGEAVDAGTAVVAGIVAALPPAGVAPDAAVEAVRFEPLRDRLLAWWRRLGFPDTQLADVVVPAPTCGMAGAEPAYVRRVDAALRDVGRAVAEL